MTTDSLGELGERIRQLARVPNLLVACDYDGTMAELTDDPMQAFPHRNSVAAVRALAEQANTHVAVISGRSLRDLATLSRFPEEIRLVGSHGSEFDLGFSAELSDELIERRRQITEAVQAIGARHGARVEGKPTGVVLHFRGLPPEVADAARAEVVRGPAGLPGISTRNGRDVVEMSVIQTNKGWALDTIRSQVGASAVVFVGDDVTDEDAFRTLAGPDVGIKVGEGKTAAGFRVHDIETVAQILALLGELRSDWLRGSGLVPLEEHTMLSDLRTAAIISPTARISWLCAPRIDSAAVFAELLGGPSAGYFAITDANGDGPIDQRYVSGSMIAESRFNGFTLTDYLDVSNDRSQRLAGRSDLLRVLEASASGSGGTARIEFAPRLDFGRFPTRLEIRDDGVAVMGTADLMVLRSPGVEWTLMPDGHNVTAVGVADLSNGPVALELRAGTGTLREDSRTEPDRRDETERFWRSWLSQLELPGIERELVGRSALTLKGLCHGPTGAIVAAATMSLPEHLGGVRNWDFRYCWLRHASLTASALARLGSHVEGMAFLDWVLNILSTRSDPERLAPLYNVTGRHLPPEAEITELPGYGGSRPVRVGNAAEGQVQLDVFGPIVDLVHTLLSRGEALSSEHWRLVESMVLAVSRRWTEPDHGIWEIRKPPRHHVYSKVMCWVSVDRAISIADQFLDREPAAWVDLRAEIATDILTHGWKPDRGTFTAAYDGDDLDASVLAVGLSGLLPPDDPRFVSTVNTVERELRNGNTVYRYLEDDGLPGREGGFHLMTSWLIDSLDLVGRRDEAIELFGELCALTGGTGLLTEQYDPASRRALGNLPQAYSHLGLINNALNLDR
ncbi:MAG: trehalose-phosphatase [Acidimicrobiales bacterium]